MLENIINNIKLKYSKYLNRKQYLMFLTMVSITREEAIKLLNKYISTKKLIQHSLAVEAIMKEMAIQLEEDTKVWSLVGLLHDLDYDYTQGNPEQHTQISSTILQGLIPEKGINAIKAHNYIHTDYTPTTDLDKSLLSADAVSGFVIAVALIMPTKKINDVKKETLIKKFKDNSFAKGCNRNKINLCQDLGIKLEDFLELSLNELSKISKDLDL
jgi:putative nucleotidyltransferase with HDIG domain